MFVYAEVKQGHAFCLVEAAVLFSTGKSEWIRPSRNWFYRAVLFNLNKPFASDVAGKRIGHIQKEATWL